MPASQRRRYGAAAGDATGGSQTITRALGVLRTLRDSATDVGVTEISQSTDLPASTVHRILRTLVAAGYVVQNVETVRYRLGREAFLLGRAAGHTLGFDAARPLLEDVAASTGESVNLVVRDGDSGLVVLRVESHHPLRYIQQTGTRIPLYCTSSGKVLLAFAGDVDAEVAGLGELEPLTDTTLTSRAGLLEDLARVRRRGFSINHGERFLGVYGLAAPLLSRDGTLIAALAVQGPEFRLPEARFDELGETLIETAQKIVAALPAGYQI